MTADMMAQAIIAKVYRFMDAYVEMLGIREKIESGEVLEIQGVGLMEITNRINILMRDIKDLQDSLGYNVGFPFERDANFKDFSIKDGNLVGDLSEAYLIITPWIEDFCIKGNRSEDAFYKFFIGAFIMGLTEYKNLNGQPSERVKPEEELGVA